MQDLAEDGGVGFPVKRSQPSAARKNVDILEARALVSSTPLTRNPGSRFAGGGATDGFEV